MFGTTNDLNHGPLLPSPSPKLASLSPSCYESEAETRIAVTIDASMNARCASACSGLDVRVPGIKRGGRVSVVKLPVDAFREESDSDRKHLVQDPHC